MATIEDNFGKILKQAGIHVALSAVEKEDMRERVVSFMAYKPLRTPLFASVSKQQNRLFSGYSSVYTRAARFFNTHLVPGLAVLALLFGGAGVTAYAAEEALPGDLLYGIKVRVNEEMYAALLFSDVSRLDWLARRAERRLEEMAALVAEGALDALRTEEVTRVLAEHVEDTRALAQEVIERDAAHALSVTEEMETTLDSQGSVLARLAVEDGALEGTRQAIEKITAEAQALRKTQEGARMALAVQSNTRQEIATTSEARNARAAPTIAMEAKAHDRLEALLAAIEDVSEENEEAARKAATQADVARQLMAEANALLAEGSYDESLAVMSRGRALAIQAKSLLDAELLFRVSMLPDGALTTFLAASNEDEREELYDAREGRTRTEEIIQEVRTLLAKHSFPVKTATKATNLLKDAQAFKLRGDIMISLGDKGKANRLFASAERSASLSLELLKEARRDGSASVLPQAPADEGKGGEGKEDREKGTPVSSDNPGTNSSLPPGLPRLDVVMVRHSFDAEAGGGTHTYSGTFVTPTSCFELAADARVAESYPEQITLLLTVKKKEGAFMCVQMLDEKAFSVTITASPQARLAEVRVNDESSEFDVVEE